MLGQKRYASGAVDSAYGVAKTMTGQTRRSQDRTSNAALPRTAEQHRLVCVALLCSCQRQMLLWRRWLQVRVVSGNPCFGKLSKVVGFCNKFLDFRFCSDIRHIIVNHVAFAAAGIEISS